MFLWAYNGWGLYLLGTTDSGHALRGLLSLECDESLGLCQFVKKSWKGRRGVSVWTVTHWNPKSTYFTQGIIGEERKSQLIHTWAWLSMSLIQNMFNITALHYVKTSIISHYLLCSDHYAEIMVTSARPLKYSTLFHIRRHSFLRDFTFPFTATEAVNSTKGLSSLD